MGIFEDLHHLDHERTIQRLVEKLSANLKARWCDHASDYWETHRCRLRFADFVRFVEKAAAAASNPYYSKKALRELRLSNNNETQRPCAQSAAFATCTKGNWKQDMCSYCAVGGHHIANCMELAKFKLEDWRGLIMSKGLCWGCLEAGHRSAFCKNKEFCQICKRQHPTVLHDDSLSKRKTETATRLVVAATKSAEVIENVESEVTNLCVGVVESTIYHGVLPILVRTSQNPE